MQGNYYDVDMFGVELPEDGTQMLDVGRPEVFEKGCPSCGNEKLEEWTDANHETKAACEFCGWHEED